MKAKRLWQKFVKTLTGKQSMLKKPALSFSSTERLQTQTTVLKSPVLSQPELPVTPSYALALVDEILDFSKLSEYEALMLKYEKLNAFYERLMKSLTETLDANYLMSPDMQPLQDRIHRLKAEIRAATKGVPVNVELDSPDDGFIPEFELQGGEQNREARRYMCKILYRKLAAALHPDRKTGNAELFEQVNKAYRRKDFYMLELYYNDLILSKDPKWQQADGLKRARELVKKPEVDIQMMKQSILWLAYTEHLKGNHLMASYHSKCHLIKLAEVLEKELHHIHISRINHGNI